MTQQRSPDDNARAPIDRTRTSRGGGSIGLVLLIALVLVGAAGGLLFIGRAKAEPYILALLAVLAMVGVFLLFALAAGILRTSGREAASPLLKAVVDGANEGILVTDASGRVLYANAAYLRLVEAPGPQDVRPVERVFVGDPGVSEAVYRLLKAAREGRRMPGRGPHRRARRRGGALAAHARAPARRRQARIPHDRLGAGRRDARARAPRECVPGAAARDRLSRPRAGRVLFGRGQRQHRLSQRHARELARSRSRAGRLRRSQARRRRRRRGRRAADHARGRAGRGQDRDVRHRSQDPHRPHRPGPAVPQGRVRRGRRARPLAHARSSTAPATAASIRSAPPKCASCASSRTRRWRSRPSTSRARIVRFQRALRAPVQPRIQGREFRRPLDPRGRRRARPGQRSKPRSGRRRKAGRDRPGRRRARRPGRALCDASSSPRSRTSRIATRRPPSSTRSRPRSSARSRTSSPSSRRWRRSAGSPATSRTTSTTCSAPS